MSVLVCDAGVKKTLVTLACHIKTVKMYWAISRPPQIFFNCIFLNLVHPVYIHFLMCIYIYVYCTFFFPHCTNSA